MAGDAGGSGTMSDLGSLVPVALLLATLSYATESQGTFYPAPFHVFVILVTGSLVTTLVLPRSASWWRAIVRDPVVRLSVVLAFVTVKLPTVPIEDA